MSHNEARTKTESRRSEGQNFGRLFVAPNPSICCTRQYFVSFCEYHVWKSTFMVPNIPDQENKQGGPELPKMGVPKLQAEGVGAAAAAGVSGIQLGIPADKCWCVHQNGAMCWPGHNPGNNIPLLVVLNTNKLSRDLNPTTQSQ